MSLFKKYSMLGKGIYVRCLGLRMSTEASDPVIEVVYGDEEHVGALLGK